MPITRQQFDEIKSEAEQAILTYAERKDALVLAQKLERESLELKRSDPDFFAELEKVIAKLKWVACPIIRDNQEFYNLTRYHLLKGIQIPQLLEIVMTRLAFQFEYELPESLNILLAAMRENEQAIGDHPIMVAGQTKPARPVVKNWLIDFIRTSPSRDLSEVDEANYLYNNKNAKALGPEERDILGKILSFYDTFRYFSQEIARQAIYESRQAQASQALVAEPRQKGESDFYDKDRQPDYPSQQNPNPVQLLRQARCQPYQEKMLSESRFQTKTWPDRRRRGDQHQNLTGIL